MIDLKKNSIEFEIEFENADTSPFLREEFHKLIYDNKDLLRKKIEKYCEYKQKFFLHQINENTGIILDKDTNGSLENKGDYIITNQKNIAIGTLTADCLPIVFYDNKNHVCAITHAGWKGTVKKIAQITFENMNNKFGSNPEDITIFFGPGAKKCCYEVDLDFISNIDSIFADQTLMRIDNKYLFDIPGYNKLLLNQIGIKNIIQDYNFCTICDARFCSYRRDKERSGLQVSTVMLK